MRPLLPTLAATTLLGGGLAACGGSDSNTTTSTPSTATTQAAAPAPSGKPVIDIKDFAYAPPSLTVKAGTTITVTNEDSAPHTATAKTGKAFDSDTLKQGQTARFKVTKPGTYAYYCVFHPYMKGQITVTK